ncbi:hypothetical protein SAMN05428989_3938 [Pseudoxanthomonas sp. GM95]|uniref:hypothetical protein n=1 Tax=Pseudoxanthomonas sp. GM95 TaxID=1881043 RepID=UPI0008CF7CDE|nr:hypothetical protein [Pseudoxanthomonas sp. GM95]SEM47051.1 hypothetical protein SAMN05428989_3938 [Pseudoxanthomonas sp. GM95]
MHTDTAPGSSRDPQRWLTRYYALRAAFSFAWVAAAFLLAPRAPAIASVLLIVYPAWDAFANGLDAQRSGGLRRNRAQAINGAVSVATTIAVLIALSRSMHGVLAVYGAWAILAGLLQFGAAVQRRRFGAQWAMMLSGGQSALAGGFFIFQSLQPTMPSIANVAGYAMVGAVYFLISALWLAVKGLRTQRALG